MKKEDRQEDKRESVEERLARNVDESLRGERRK